MDPETRQQIRRLALLNFFTDLRFYAPVAVLFYASVAGSFAAGMVFMSIAAVTTVVVELPAGVFSDRKGRIATLRAGAVFHAVSSVLMLAAAVFLNRGQSARLFLYLSAAFEGMGRAFYSGNNDSLVHDMTRGRSETGDGEFSETLGRLKSMFQFALALSALVGGFLAVRGWIFVLIPSTLSLLTALGFAFSVRLPEHLDDIEESGQSAGGLTSSLKHLGTSMKSYFGHRRMLANGIAEVVGAAVGEATYQFRVTFIASVWPAAWLGASRMLDNLSAALGFVFAGRMIRRYGEYPLLIAGKVYGRIANLIGLLLPGLHSPPVMSSAGLFYGLTDVSRQSLMHRMYDDSQRATLASVNSLLGALTLAVFAPLLGLFADRYGPLAALLASQLLMLVPLAIDIVLYRKGRRHGD